MGASDTAPPRQPAPSLLSQSGGHTHPRVRVRTAASPQNQPDARQRQRDKPGHAPQQKREANLHSRHMGPGHCWGEARAHTRGLPSGSQGRKDRTGAAGAGPGWKARWPQWEPRARCGSTCHGERVSATLAFKRPQTVSHPTKQEPTPSDSHKQSSRRASSSMERNSDRQIQTEDRAGAARDTDLQ